MVNQCVAPERDIAVSRISKPWRRRRLVLSLAVT